jgi:hypothetical protein
MDVNRLNTGEKLAGASAIVLLLLMFIFDWFSLKDAPDELGGLNAWDAFSFIDIILFLAVVAGIALAAVKLMNQRLNVPLSSITAGLGGLAALLVLFRILFTPDFEALGVELETSRSIGVFLGFLAAAGVAAGGYLAMEEEGTTFGDTADRFSGGGGAGDSRTTAGPGAGPAEPPAAPPPPPPPPPPSEPRP